MKVKKTEETVQKSAENHAFSRLTIDLGAVAANYRILDDKAGADCSLAGVVKANGYGLGVTEVANTLIAQGCGRLFVATAEEAIELRQRLAMQDDTPLIPIACLGGIVGGTVTGLADAFIRHNITPVLNSMQDITYWADEAATRETKLPAIIHFDTAMNRLGLGEDETAKLFSDMSALEGINVLMIMSHFACADEKGHPANDMQYERFDQVAKGFPDALKSLANSSGIFRDPRYCYDIARPGMAMYGLNPTPEAPNPMRGVVKLETRILQTRTARKGQSVGYGATYRFDKNSELATVALGYADGFLRSNSSRATLFFEGHPCPVLGRVSMDLVTVDISGLEKKPKIGDYLEVIGPNQSADEVADSAGTIGYEILTSLGRRYQRRYLD